MPCKWWRLVRPEASLFPVLAKRSCEGPRMILPSSYQMAPGCSSRTWFRVKVAKESFGINFFHIFGRGIYCWNPFWRGMIFSSEETKITTKKTTHAETMPFHCFPCQPNSARRFFTFWALSCAGFARGSTSRASCPKLEFFSGKMVGGMKTMIDNWLQDMILSDEKMDNMVHLHNTSNGGFSLHFLHEIHEFSLHCLRFDVALPEDAAPCHETIFRCLVMNLHIIPRPFVLPDSNQHHKLSTSSRRLGTA